MYTHLFAMSYHHPTQAKQQVFGPLMAPDYSNIADMKWFETYSDVDA